MHDRRGFGRSLSKYRGSSWKLLSRQVNGESGTLTRLADDVDRTAVSLHVPPHDVETQAHATDISSRVNALKGLENVRQIV